MAALPESVLVSPNFGCRANSIQAIHHEYQLLSQSKVPHCPTCLPPAPSTTLSDPGFSFIFITTLCPSLTPWGGGVTLGNGNLLAIYGSGDWSTAGPKAAPSE